VLTDDVTHGSVASWVMVILSAQWLRQCSVSQVLLYFSLTTCSGTPNLWGGGEISSLTGRVAGDVKPSAGVLGTGQRAPFPP